MISNYLEYAVPHVLQAISIGKKKVIEKHNSVCDYERNERDRRIEIEREGDSHQILWLSPLKIYAERFAMSFSVQTTV